MPETAISPIAVGGAVEWKIDADHKLAPYLAGRVGRVVSSYQGRGGTYADVEYNDEGEDAPGGVVSDVPSGALAASTGAWSEAAAEEDRFSPLSEESGVPAWWKKRRSLTADEAGKLKVKKADLECSLAFVDGKGYCAYTHRARSAFYPTPEGIPAKALKFISSTS
jgi:hypothetical protein